MAGVDLYTVQRAGGWKSQVMVQRYAHLSPDHMRAAVERLAPVERAAQQEIRDQNRDWKVAGLGVRPVKSLTGHGDPGVKLPMKQSLSPWTVRMTLDLPVAA